MHNTKALGNWGENLARDWLKVKGYRFLEQNIHLSNKELDLVAFDGEILVFIEVKTRASSRFGTAIEMMSKNKIRNLKFAAMSFLNQTKLHYKNIRLDVVAIDVNRVSKKAKICHYKDII